MQITVPTTVKNKPQKISINGVSYTLMPGDTITVPDAVAAELARMIGASVKNPPAVDPPFQDAAVGKVLSEIKRRLADLEAVVPELPEAPSTDGTYSLQLVMDDGEAAFTWEAVPVAQAET